MRLLKIIFIYSLLIIYSLEFLLFFTLPEEQKSMIKIKEERVKKAKELNREIDLRSPDQFYIDKKKIIKILILNFYTQRPLVHLKFLEKQKKIIKLYLSEDQ